MRSIIEEAILDVMFEIPSMENVQKCIVTEEVIEKKAAPTLIYKEEEAKEEKTTDDKE